VIFPENISIDGINDSKELTPEEREELFQIIMEKALAVGVAYTDNVVIDKINILQATYLSMKRALAKLKIVPDVVLVDGYPIPDLLLKQGIHHKRWFKIYFYCSSIYSCKGP